MVSASLYVLSARLPRPNRWAWKRTGRFFSRRAVLGLKTLVLPSSEPLPCGPTQPGLMGQAFPRNRTIFPRILTGLKPPDVRRYAYFRPANRTDTRFHLPFDIVAPPASRPAHEPSRSGRFAADVCDYFPPRRWQDAYPKAVSCLRDDLDELLTCFRDKTERSAAEPAQWASSRTRPAWIVSCSPSSPMKTNHKARVPLSR